MNMDRDKHIIAALNSAELADAPVPGLPLIELAGDRRILIEHHCGVIEYGTERVCVKVKFGQVCISGEELCLAKMSKNQLIICGKIQCVELYRGCK